MFQNMSKEIRKVGFPLITVTHNKTISAGEALQSGYHSYYQ